MRSLVPPRSGSADRKPADRPRRPAAGARPARAPFQLSGGAGARREAPEPAAPSPTATRASGPLPDRLQTVMEAMSGFSLADVVVHRNSAEPVRLGAAAFTRGNRIHLAPGQERHLPHEAWHAVQQKQGRVHATRQFKGAALNDDRALEREADAMGARAMAGGGAAVAATGPGAASLAPVQAQAVVQRTVWELGDTGWQPIDGQTNAPAPSIPDAEEGMVYDDQASTLYRNRGYYEIFSKTDLPETDTMDSDYVDTGVLTPDSDEDESQDDQSAAMDTTVSNSNQTEMDVEARRKIDADALAMPLTGSLLTAPDSRFKSRTMTSKDKFKVGKVMGQRTQTAGAVAITLQAVSLWVNDKVVARERPTKVVGIVDPTKTTGRGGAPDPLSGYQIYSGEGARPKASIESERNTGARDVERGHIMALELGGPDIPENIVPQWAKFQGSGGWRRMEVAVLAKANALKKGQLLRYAVEIFYKSSGTITPTLRTFSFPTGFKTTTQVIDGKAEGPLVVEFHQGQSQDVTDQKLAEREMGKLEGSDWDTSLNVEKPGAKKKRTSLKSTAKVDPTVSKKKAKDKQKTTAKTKRQETLKKSRNSG